MTLDLVAMLQKSWERWLIPKVNLGEKLKGVLEHEEAFDVHDR
jgi:hypothetical protein